jgi:hypothetical protein
LPASTPAMPTVTPICAPMICSTWRRTRRSGS